MSTKENPRDALARPPLSESGDPCPSTPQNLYQSSLLQIRRARILLTKATTILEQLKGLYSSLSQMLGPPFHKLQRKWRKWRLKTKPTPSHK